MRFDEGSVFFQELMNHVSTNPSGVVPFVGAGLSRYGHPNNQLPGWYDLIQRLKKHCDDLGLLSGEDLKTSEEYIRKAEFISITDFLVDRLGEPLFRQFIRRELDISDKKTSPAIIDLVMVSWSLIVTTNLDTFLETEYANQTKEIPNIVTSRQLPELADAISGATSVGSISIAKIHGTLNDAESWALTSSHYKKLLSYPQYLDALKTLFMKRIFFVGFGLSDDDFDLVQDYLAKVFPEGVGDFYALLPSSARGGPALIKLIRERGLKPIFYDVEPRDESDPWGGHSGMGQCLSALARVWSNSRSDLPVTLKYFPELESTFFGREAFMEEMASDILHSKQSVQIVGFGGEGKTTVVQHWLQSKHFEIRDAGYEEVFGFSFYHASVEHFINDAFRVVCQGTTGISISRRLQRLIETLRLRPILFVLDGMEILLDAHGDLQNPDFRKFFDALQTSSSKAICTSRIPLNYSLSRLPLYPLGPEDAQQLFSEGADSANINQDFIKQAGGHALSLRILSSLTEEYEVAGNIPLENAAELDPLHGNKLKRILEYYGSILEEKERALMVSASIFPGPVEYSLLETICTESFKNSEINASLINVDIRKVVYDLLSKRLLVTVSGDLLSAHPNVRNYFNGLVKTDSLRPLHRQAAFELLQKLPTENPVSLEECKPFLDAAYHCCLGHLWVEFHHVFKDRLNRGNKNYLANVISAWSDFGRLATLCLANNPPEDEIDLAYYAACNARALKHLGHHEDVQTAYSKCLSLCASSKVPETARYLNNWLTHRIYSGKLTDARRMVRWNYGLLDWPQDEYHRRWQQEHADLSFAWLSGLLGDIQQALDLFTRSKTAWEGFGDGHLQFFDALSNVEAEFLVSLESPKFLTARKVFNKRLELSRKNNWREATIRALISGSYIERAALCIGYNSSSAWDLPLRYLDEAAELESQIGLPTSRLLVVLEQLRLALDMKKVGIKSPWEGKLHDLLEVADRLLERTRWELYRPELLALSGRVHMTEANQEYARRKLTECINSSKETGNVFALIAPFQSFQALKMDLEVTGNATCTTSSVSELAMLFRPEITKKMLLEACQSDFHSPILPTDFQLLDC